MLGIIMTIQEQKEIEYLLKREMDELLFEFKDERIEGIVKRAMEERYQILFRLFLKVAAPETCMKYMRTKRY